MLLLRGCRPNLGLGPTSAVSDVAIKRLACQDIVRRVANKSVTSWQQVCCVVVMEFGKRHDTTDRVNRHNGLFPARQLVTDVLRGNWCNGFWP